MAYNLLHSTDSDILQKCFNSTDKEFSRSVVGLVLIVPYIIRLTESIIFRLVLNDKVSSEAKMLYSGTFWVFGVNRFSLCGSDAVLRL